MNACTGAHPMSEMFPAPGTMYDDIPTKSIARDTISLFHLFISFLAFRSFILNPKSADQVSILFYCLALYFGKDSQRRRIGQPKTM